MSKDIELLSKVYKNTFPDSVYEFETMIDGENLYHIEITPTKTSGESFERVSRVAAVYTRGGSLEIIKAGEVSKVTFSEIYDWDTGHWNDSQYHLLKIIWRDCHV